MLEKARFTELEIKLSSVEQRDGQTVALGRIEAQAQANAGEKRGNISGSYGAFWTKTPVGWRLKRDDATFNPLSQVALWEVAPLATSFNEPKTLRGLPRQNPTVVLEQAHRGQVEPIAFAPAGKTLATYDFYDGLRLIRRKTALFKRPRNSDVGQFDAFRARWHAHHRSKRWFCAFVEHRNRRDET